MIILQTAGGGGFGPGEWVATGLGSQATTFRDNSYIHRLNRTLQGELRLVSAYAGTLPRLEREHPFHGFCCDHQRAAKDLVRLVISNHGIPEENSPLSLGVTRSFAQFCSVIPGRLVAKARQSTFEQLEKHQRSAYLRLIEEAPGRDIEDLGALLRLTETHIAHLT